mgnify:CR=1 FL=1
MIGARVVDWETRFVEFLNKNKSREFKWGEFDCSQFCILAEKAICEESRWEDFIGGYKTQKGAEKRILKGKANSLWELIDQRMERKPVLMAQRGDWIGHLTPQGEALGIMDANGFWATAENGLEFINIDQAKVAWTL